MVSFFLILVFVLFYKRYLWNKSFNEFGLEKIQTGKKYIELSKEVKELPEPVKKYFNLVLKDGSLFINSLLLKQEGAFLISPDSKKHLETKAKQKFHINTSSFIWDSKISFFPFISLNVRDSYIKDKGLMRVTLFYLFDLVRLKDKKELSEASLQRYLAEAVWFPTALLPSNGVVWESIDKTKAKATISNKETTVSLEFRFDGEGYITSVYSPNRLREQNKQFIPTPWEGEYSCYKEFNGYKVPSRAKVKWYLKSGEYTYFKVYVKDIIYEFM